MASMDHYSIKELKQVSYHAWFKRIFTKVYENATIPNFVGLISGLFALFCLLALSSPWNIRLPLYLMVAIWTLIRPRVALYLLPLAIPWGSLDSIDLGGLHLNSADILVALLAASWLMSFTLPTPIAHRATQPGPLDHDKFNVPRYLVIAMGILLLTMLISMTTTFNLNSSLKEIIKWLEALVIILLGTQYLRTRRQIWTLVVIIALATLSQAFFGYTQYLFNLGPTAFVRDASLRVYGTFDQPNPFAGYINMGLCIAIALMLLARNWTIQLLATPAAILLAGALYLTQSRGGEIAITVALIFILLVGMPRLRPLMGVGAIGALAILGAYFAGLLPERSFTPILRTLGLVKISFTTPTSQDFSTAERLAHWIAGIRMFLDHPFSGVGIGNYPDAYPKYFLTIFVNPLGHAHNYYINIAAETGIFGLLALLFFLLATFVAGGQAFRTISRKCMPSKMPKGHISIAIPPLHNNPKFLHDRALAVGLLAALISVCVHNLVDNLYVHSMTNLFALLLVILIRLEGVTSNIGHNGGYFDH